MNKGVDRVANDMQSDPRPLGLASMIAHDSKAAV